jgi:hypothetical protein
MIVERMRAFENNYEPKKIGGDGNLNEFLSPLAFN